MFIQEEKIQKKKLVPQMTPAFFPQVERNVSFHKSESKGEDNINFQFIFCLSQEWDHGGDAVKTHESEYLPL